MSIIYLENDKIFSLKTRNTSYIFGIYEEKPNYKNSSLRLSLRSLYWGKKVERTDDFIRSFNWLINGYNDGGKQSHERFACEYVGAGGLFSKP